MMLSKEQILKSEDLPREKVNVPEWGGDVYVRTMTAEEKDTFDMSMIRKGDGDEREVDLRNLRSKLCALTIVDEDGNRLFDESEVDSLAQKSCLALGRIHEVAERLNGMGAEATEAIVKNSVTTEQSDSSSD